MSLRALAPTDRLVVRLVARSPRDRMDPKRPEPWLLEAGFEGLTGGDGLTTAEKGRMVSILFADDAALPEAMHRLADLWDRQHRRDASLRVPGRLPCGFDIILAGQRGTIVTEAARLADDLHFVADCWIRERRVFRIRTQAALRRAMAPKVEPAAPLALH